MKQYKIYGVSYELGDTAEDAIDSYAYKGELFDEEPSGIFVGYVTMEDGSVVACYKKKSKLLAIILLIVALAAITVAAYEFVLPMFQKEVAIGGTMLQVDTGTNVVVFNGIMQCSDGQIDVRFVNGKTPATIQVSGDGVETQEYSVDPEESVEFIPVTITTNRSVVEVKVRINSDGTVSEFNALAEIPDNNTDYDPMDGLSSYFEKELILDELIE